MTFEPRMRGSRFRRPAMKKQSAKDRREEHESSRFYEEQVPVDPSQVSTGVLNALGHLGAQRFALPPFSEHFERWIKDVRAVFVDMESKLPTIADQTYREESERILSKVQDTLRKRTDAENQESEEMSKLQQDLASCELELANLERDYKTRISKAKNAHEHSLEKLKGEIDSLDKRRLRLLRKQPSLFDRILRRPSAELEESTRALQTKRNAVGTQQSSLKQELSNLRTRFEASTKQLNARRETLKTKLTELKANTPDDASDLRNQVCQELGRIVTEAINRLTQPKTSPDTKNIQ